MSTLGVVCAIGVSACAPDVHSVDTAVSMPDIRVPVWESDFVLHEEPLGAGDPGAPVVAVLYDREYLTGRLTLSVNDQLLNDEPAGLHAISSGVGKAFVCALGTALGGSSEPLPEDFFDDETRRLIDARTKAGYRWMSERVPWEILKRGNNIVGVLAGGWTNPRAGQAAVAAVMVSNRLSSEDPFYCPTGSAP